MGEVKEYCILTLMVIGRTLMSFLSPIGINRLLAYVVIYLYGYHH